MHWNHGVGGADGCDGVMRLHAWQVFLMLMSDVIPDQKTEASAFVIMDETP